MMEKKLTLALGGEMCGAAVLFSDIRGFTSTSEKLEPRRIVEMLNRYFEIMVQIVFKHGGTVSKFTGDGMYLPPDVRVRRSRTHAAGDRVACALSHSRARSCPV